MTAQEGGQPDDALADSALRESEATFRLLFDSNPQPMWLYDRNTLEFIRVNDAAVAHYGYSHAEFAIMRITDIRPPEDVPALLEDLRTERPDRQSSGPWRHLLKDGRRIHVEITSQQLEVAGREAVFVMALDVTERKVLEEQLRHQAFHDSLTNLANRELFSDRLTHALARRGRTDDSLAVIFLDVDDFKTVNDSLGHSAGDELLTTVALRLLQAVRPADTVARFGGDEFAVLLEDIPGRATAVDLAARICKSLQVPTTVQGQSIVMRASAGVALGGSTESAETLLGNADVAMYLAKKQDKGGFRLFEPSMRAAILDRLQLEADMRRTIEADEFRIHYQPTVDLTTGQIMGVEALVRWEHPQRGLVPPLHFIPTAEDTGLIVPIGRWVLRQACAQARRWQEQYPDRASLGVSVNLSPRQLRDPGLTDDVAAALRDSGLDPGCLTLEITESVLVTDAEAGKAALVRLKELGVRLAIDDFGTGYSSLSYLQHFPIDVLKIDKSFVDTIGTGLESSALVNAIVHMGASMQLETVAEGIELPGQVGQLRDMACQLGQGFYFARPLPVNELEELLAHGAVDAPEPLEPPSP